MASGWNARYETYARAHGRDPDAQLAADRERWPGGWMTGYLVWLHARWAEYQVISGCNCAAPSRHGDDFDAWLWARASGLAERESEP